MLAQNEMMALFAKKRPGHVLSPIPYGKNEPAIPESLNFGSPISRTRDTEGVEALVSFLIGPLRGSPE